MELESLAGCRPGRELGWRVNQESDGWVLDPLPLLIELGERRRQGQSPAELAADFHESIAAAMAELARRASEAAALSTVALGGGVFQNVRLLLSLEKRLSRLGLEVLVPVRLGPNDGAVSYGQAAIAAARLAGRL